MIKRLAGAGALFTVCFGRYSEAKLITALPMGGFGMEQFVLASASPRRQQLLAQLGLQFRVVASGINEENETEPDPSRLVARLALDKAVAVAREMPECVVLAADTVVVHQGNILGKPLDVTQAEEMLRALSGDEHQVYTGVALMLLAHGRQEVFSQCTRVWFRQLDTDIIRAYVSSGEPLDKAGAYGIQELGSLLVEKIDGCFYNVVGLPLPRVADALRRFGIDPWRLMNSGVPSGD